MLPRVGGCCHVRLMHAAWRGTANTSWAFCRGPVTTTRRHACPCRRSTCRSDLWPSLRRHPQLGGVAVATAEQLRAPCATAASESRRRRPASEPGVSARPRIIKMIFLFFFFYQDTDFGGWALGLKAKLSVGNRHHERLQLPFPASLTVSVRQKPVGSPLNCIRVPNTDQSHQQPPPALLSPVFID